MIHRPINFHYAALIITVIAAAVAWNLMQRLDHSSPESVIAPTVSAVWRSGGAGFVYNGAPIDPSCVDAILNFNGEIGTQTAYLATCGAAPEKGTITTNDYGFITDEYARDMSDPEFPGGAPMGYGSYRVVASNGNDFILQTLMSGGGSGNFGDVIMVRKNGDSLQLVKDIAGVGDRCNMGISSAVFEKGMLTYDRNVTPYAIQLLATGEDPTTDNVYKKYRDLADSAASCYATAEYSYDLATDKDSFVSMNDETEGLEEATGGNKTQKCFNALYLTAMGVGGTLDREHLSELGKAVETKCLSK